VLDLDEQRLLRRGPLVEVVACRQRHPTSYDHREPT
jgi:hypothetical protein